jgi:hypothetical protein
MGLFGKRQEPKQDDVRVEQPEVSQVDTNKICRACTHGIGDGLCSYHTNQWRRVIQRNEKIIK